MKASGAIKLTANTQFVSMRKCKLGSLMDVTRGASLSGEYYSSAGALKRLTLANFDYSRNCFKEDLGKNNLFYLGKVDPRFVLKSGDIITPLTEQTPGLLGTTAIVPEDGKYIQSQDVALIRPDKSVLDEDFAFYLVSSKTVRNQLGAQSQQTKIRHSSPDKIKDCWVFVPSLPVQKDIGSFLKCLDRKIALNRRKIATLEKMAKEIYDYWFVQYDFPDANGRPYKSSGGEMVYSPELKREIPKGWKVDTLRSRVKSVETGEWGSDEATDDAIEVHCLRGADMVDQSSLPRRFITRKKAGKLLSIGDLVVEISGGSPTQATGRICHVTEGLLKSYQGNLTCTNFCNSIKLEQPKEVASFYMLWKRLYAAGVMFGFEGKTSGLKNLQIDSFLSLKWDFAPLSLAEKYNELYDKMVAACDDSKQIIARCEQIRDFLLPLLMNGQVKVGE